MPDFLGGSLLRGGGCVWKPRCNYCASEVMKGGNICIKDSSGDRSILF